MIEPLDDAKDTSVEPDSESPMHNPPQPDSELTETFLTPRTRKPYTRPTLTKLALPPPSLSDDAFNC
jgi:hypothetical protein